MKVLSGSRRRNPLHVLELVVEVLAGDAHYEKCCLWQANGYVTRWSLDGLFGGAVYV